MSLFDGHYEFADIVEDTIGLCHQIFAKPHNPVLLAWRAILGVGFPLR